MQDSELVAVARNLKPHLDLDELVLLSSCNRDESYGTTRRAITDGKSLSRLLGSETEDLTPQVCLYKGVAAARHLLRVTASLDSMVLAGRSLMVIGAGRMAESCVRLLVKKDPLDSDFQSLSRPLPRSGHPLGRTNSNATERNAKAASVSMRGTFNRVTAASRRVPLPMTCTA